MDQEIRNKLRNVVTQCRKLLEDSVSQELEGKYGIFAKKDQVTADPNASMAHLTEEEQTARKDILDHFGHIKARGFKPKEALDQLVREIAFTHLNRLCAYKMMEAREVYVGGQKFREAVSRGIKSNGFLHYLGMDGHESDERLYSTGHQDVAYQHFLDWLGGLLSEEIGVLFNPNDPANRLHPRQKTLDAVLDLLNGGGIKPDETALLDEWPKIWSQDETIGWVYQYFTPKELRDAARDPKKGGSAAPRNSYELAFRNQFFTPRYVVEFLTDNTLGRIWYEMRKGDTKLKDQCRYMVRRPTEVFLKPGEQQPKEAAEGRDDLSQEELLKLPVHVPHRPKKDPRELKVLDPACGSGHFLLYCFDLLQTIYEEAYTDADLGPALQTDYPSLEDLRRDTPRLFLAGNLHGIDIDLRASQIAALALWLRCQRAYRDMGLKKDHPKITRSNFVCAEPMPGEEQMLKEFVGQLEPKLLGQIVEVVFEKMKLAGEAGSLLKIEEEIRDAVALAKRQWAQETIRATDRKGQPLLFTVATMERLVGKPEQAGLFDLGDITDEQFFEQAEARVIDALRQYAEKAQNGYRLQRRLFTDDAVRGFAFVELCQRRYDVVLMNPPFGEPSKTSRAYLYATLPSSTQDILSAFIERCVPLLTSNGLLGAITNRLIIVKDLLEQWRSDYILGQHSVMELFGDLGYGVLDEAVVEAAAYTLQRGSARLGSETCFLTVLDRVEKQHGLLSLVQNVRGGISSERCFLHEPTIFKALPKKRIAYWCSEGWLHKFSSLPHAGSFGVTAKKGLETGRDFELLRLYWEVAPAALSPMKHWTPYSKGGSYRPLHSDVHLVFDWSRQNEARRTSNADLYGMPGVTYTERTTSNFSGRVLPAQSLFSPKGPGIFDQHSSSPWGLLGWLSSSVVAFYLELLVGGGDSSAAGTAARDFSPSLIEMMPVPQSFRSLLDKLAPITQQMHDGLAPFRHDEVSCRFAGLIQSGDCLFDSGRLRFTAYECAVLDAISLFRQIDELVCDEYALSEKERNDLFVYLGRPYPVAEDVSADKVQIVERAFVQNTNTTPAGDDEENDDIQSRAVNKLCFIADPRYESLSVQIGVSPDAISRCRRELDLFPQMGTVQEALDLLSLAVGAVVGRWDVRSAFGQDAAPVLDAFDASPQSLPAMLKDETGMVASVTPEGYPVRVHWDGIIVDDAEHEDDIVRGVQHALEVFWKERADAIENEACETLDVKDLREYFRRPGKGGFWDDHITRYSKSRRKAPIYWLLQSSKKNYALWLYYHRLDKDMLFKAVVNYVEPKIRLETSCLETYRTQKAAAGESNKEGKRLAKEIERQEDFLSELRDFEDKLRRVANLHFEPDLNDGVVLNIAPLHELVPWKEAKNYWEELLAGKYEWSSIGKQLRQKGLVK